MIEIKISIEKLESGCYAWDSGCRYMYQVDEVKCNMKSTWCHFGSGGPAKDKEEIITDVKQCIKSQEEWHKTNAKIVSFENLTDLEITIADFQGNGKLTEFIEQKHDVANLIHNKDKFFCAKCGEALVSEFAQCERKCYPEPKKVIYGIVCVSCGTQLESEYLGEENLAKRKCSPCLAQEGDSK